MVKKFITEHYAPTELIFFSSPIGGNGVRFSYKLDKGSTRTLEVYAWPDGHWRAWVASSNHSFRRVRASERYTIFLKPDDKACIGKNSIVRTIVEGLGGKLDKFIE